MPLAGARKSDLVWRGTASPRTGAEGAGCDAAIRRAELTYRIPDGLLMAIGKAESGRVDAATNSLRPWPWTVNAGGQGMFFDTAVQAVAWVRSSAQTGTPSIDLGCMQVNLLHHPNAFHSLEEAFDPVQNADYAARFLRSLYDATGSWLTATGYYHSQNTVLADLYRKRVQAYYASNIINPRTAILSAMGQAWQMTLGRAAGTPANTGNWQNPGRCRAMAEPCGRR